MLDAPGPGSLWRCSGAYHGLNPAMGWLFAVALGLQERDRRGGPAGAPADRARPRGVDRWVVAVLVLGLGLLTDPSALHLGAGRGADRVRRLPLRPAARAPALGADAGQPARADVWSFLMSTAHGAGLMVAPVLIGAGRATRSGRRATGWRGGGGRARARGSRRASCCTWRAMLAVAGAVALLVYTRFGVGVLRRVGQHGRRLGGRVRADRHAHAVHLREMRAQLLDAPGRPLRAGAVADPVAGPGQVLVRVRACGVCRTDLHLRDGELSAGHLPLVLGHQIVGTGGRRRRAGRAWGSRGWAGPAASAATAAAGARTCASGRASRGATSTAATRSSRWPTGVRLRAPGRARRPRRGAAAVRRADRPPRAAPGGDAAASGSTGSARRRTSSARSRSHEGRRVFAFTRAGDAGAQALARSLGAEWAGDSAQPPPEPLDAALIFAPAGALVPLALRRSRRAAPWCAPASTCPTFPASRTPTCGRSACCAPSPTSRARTREEFLALAPRGRAAHDRDAVPAGRRRAGARRPARGAADRRRGAPPS